MSRRCSACLLLVTASILGLSGCRRGDKGSLASREATRKSKRPNIILLTADTLRADHIGFYGYKRSTLPSIAAFAQTAVIFENAVVPRGSTRPSYASMLTGLYPFHHGVRSNETELHGDIVTLQEILKSAGYHTAGFVSNFTMVSELSGLKQGFDIYDDRLEDRGGYERTAPNTLQAILRWLDSIPPQPFFLFVNFIDPHGPYSPPERLRSLYRSTSVRMLDRKQIPDYLYVDGQLNYFDYVDRYDAEIRYLDEAIGVLINELKRRGLWEESLVIFTADHGESLGEHKVFFEHHYHVYEETMRVPLVVRLPKSSGHATDSTGPRRVRGLCSPMDLTPTILAYLNLSPGALLDGRSLLPLMNGVRDDSRVLLLEFPDIATWQMSLPDVYAMRTRTHKLITILDQNTGRVLEQGVFDLVADPLEQRPIRFNPQEPLHRELAGHFDLSLARVRDYTLPFTLTVYQMPFDAQRDLVKQKRQAAGVAYKLLTEEQVQRLRGLGYVQ